MNRQTDRLTRVDYCLYNEFVDTLGNISGCGRELWEIHRLWGLTLKWQAFNWC